MRSGAAIKVAPIILPAAQLTRTQLVIAMSAATWRCCCWKRLRLPSRDCHASLAM